MEAEERIDLFLQGKLEGKDLDIFRLRLQQDEVFAEEVETRRLIISAIKEARHEELKAFIKENTLLETKVAPFPIRKFIYAAIAACVLVGVAYIIFEQVINKQDGHFISTDNEGTGKPIDGETPLANDNTSQIEKAPTEFVPPVIEIDTTNDFYALDRIPPQENVSDDVGDIEDINDDKVVVLQDKMIERKSSSDFFQKLIPEDTLMALNEKETLVVATESKRKDKVETKKSVAVPEAKPEPPSQEKVAEEKHQAFDIEFWESIVHFKGYKWDGKKLLLYGIESSEKIEFHWVSNQLFLQRGKDYFLIKQTNQFESYLKLTDQLLLDKLIK